MDKKIGFKNILGPFSILPIVQFVFMLFFLLLERIWYKIAGGEIQAHQFLPKTLMKGTFTCHN